jgi:hypothetical protein
MVICHRQTAEQSAACFRALAEYTADWATLAVVGTVGALLIILAVLLATTIHVRRY